MKYFNFPAFIVVTIASLIPDLLLLGLGLAQKAHLIPYNLKPFVSYAYQLPWTGMLFALTFGVACSLMFRVSTKIRFDELAGYVLIVPLVQYTVPLLCQFAMPFAGGLGITHGLLWKFFYAMFLGILARGILGLEALGALSVIILGLVGAGVDAVAYIPKLPIYPGMFWYMFVGGAMAFMSAKEMR